MENSMAHISDKDLQKLGRIYFKRYQQAKSRMNTKEEKYFLDQYTLLGEELQKREQV